MSEERRRQCTPAPSRGAPEPRCVARDAWRHEPAGSASLRNAMTSQPATGSPEIALLDLEKRFKEVCAVDGVSLEIAAGEFFSLLDAAPA